MSLVNINTFGAFLSGVIVSTAMYGITSAQMVWYYRTYRDDRQILKGAVGLLWLMDSLQQALLLHAMYFYLITSREKGDFVALLSANWSVISMIIPGEISVSLVEIYFVWRIIRFWKKNYMFLVIIPLFAGTVYAGKAFRYPPFNESTRGAWIMWLSGGGRAATDLIIAVIMSYKLYTSRGIVIAHRQLFIVLTNYAIATGTLTCVFAITYLITYVTMPFNMYYAGVYCVHTKIHVNSMMATLNSRQSLRGMAGRTVNVWSDSDERNRLDRLRQLRASECGVTHEV
ncbi:hypothetical protein NEOLEDRAFT_526418 [Neolentinus lepideus HHB14362 ss-1]|uniref:DUF6534 domain-containing protein n=1 Tax=Neolentinus lepideus HHB14362 ss-1 TaxID=1314782 RepID=A0A165RDC7_9AGAM|nr:hypothetical protein NEOLEDRAFT_526418 [Neolentinus lepideus HHB14362 ss-1]